MSRYDPYEDYGYGPTPGPTPYGRGSRADYRVHERKTSGIKVAGALAGSAALAWGAPRMAYLGNSLRRGAKLANTMNKPGLQAKLERGEALRNAAVRRTAGIGGVVRRIPGATKIPHGARPAVGVLGGSELVRWSTPTHKDTYKPVSASDVYGW